MAPFSVVTEQNHILLKSLNSFRVGLSDSLAHPAPDGASSEAPTDCRMCSGNGFGERMEIAVGDGLVIRLTSSSNADFLVQVVAGLMGHRL